MVRLAIYTNSFRYSFQDVFTVSYKTGLQNACSEQDQKIMYIFPWDTYRKQSYEQTEDLFSGLLQYKQKKAAYNKKKKKKDNIYLM